MRASDLRIAALMTVFNRRDDTVQCLRSLADQDRGGGQLDVFVVDDASSDGTEEAVSTEFPDVRLIRGTGDLYWNGGMRLAFEAALSEGYDFYWWLNDDVVLDRNSLARLIEASEQVATKRGRKGIVVGSMRDPIEGYVTYGGVVRKDRLRPFDFTLVQPDDSEPVEALTMNGNCVLVPKEVAHNLGNLSRAYRQKMGDFDYGLRARDRGYEVWVAPGTYGACATHPLRSTAESPLIEEVRRLWSIKELPFGPWMTFTRRWGGPLWPIYFLSPYLQRSVRLLAGRVGGNTS